MSAWGPFVLRCEQCDIVIVCDSHNNAHLSAYLDCPDCCREGQKAFRWLDTFEILVCEASGRYPPEAAVPIVDGWRKPYWIKGRDL